MTAWASTGLKGLDKVLCDLKKGDNVVWQVRIVPTLLLTRQTKTANSIKVQLG